MGIAKSAYCLLLEEKKRGNLEGDSILQLGRQCVLFDYETLLKYARKHNVKLMPVEPELSFNSHYRKLKFIDDITLFKALGFKNVHSLDYSSFEGANFIWDLNKQIPETHYGQYDLVYDGGTAEHVFHFPQVLANIHHLLKPEGIAIHVSPSTNHVDHGFYMYSPQVYFEYYTANQYSILTSQFIEYTSNYRKGWSVYPYQPGILDPFCIGGFGEKLILIHIVVRKQTHSTFGLIPQQGSYVRAWRAAQSLQPQNKRKVNPVKRLGISLKKKIGRILPFRLKRYLKWKQLPKYTQL